MKSISAYIKYHANQVCKINEGYFKARKTVHIPPEWYQQYLIAYQLDRIATALEEIAGRDQQE